MSETRRILSRIHIFVFAACFLQLLVSCSVWTERTSQPASAYIRVATSYGLDERMGEPFGVAIRDGKIYVSDGEAGAIFEVLPNASRRRVIATGLNAPSAIALMPNGHIVVADTGSHTIKEIADDGSITIVAGVENVSGSDDGPARAATFNGPIGIAVDERGIYVADTYNDRIRLIRDGTVSTFAGSVRGFADGPVGTAKFDTPLGLAIWQDRLLVADSGNGRVRAIEVNGDVSTLAGAGDGGFRDGSLLQAGFITPTAIAVDYRDVIFVADGNAIRAIGRRTFPFVETIAGDRRGF